MGSTRATGVRRCAARAVTLVLMGTSLLVAAPAAAASSLVSADIGIQSTATVLGGQALVTVTVTNNGPNAVDGLWIDTFVGHATINGWTTTAPLTPCWLSRGRFSASCHHNKLRPHQVIQIKVIVICSANGWAFTRYDQGAQTWTDGDQANDTHWIRLRCA